MGRRRKIENGASYNNKSADSDEEMANTSDNFLVKLVQNNTLVEMSELYNSSHKRLTGIHEIIRSGKLDALGKAIDRVLKNSDLSLNKMDDTGFSALHHATRYNRVEAMAELIRNGSIVDITTRDEWNTPLHIAAR
ncbi:predicted protein [Nematostella vectensis]|uniref:Uncharacterized protein n=3 Tax=Nematostella vectensis TaxID=45351 RepID=A7SC10_NEMVE|nr:predicted protein [Nematostella vectensis]|eukprot:XP_001630787.1 predicted protein [Nematostella vectensis]